MHNTAILARYPESTLDVWYWRRQICLGSVTFSYTGFGVCVGDNVITEDFILLVARLGFP